MIYAIIGLIMLVLFLCLYIAYVKGYRLTKDKPIELSQEEKYKAEQRVKEFGEVMDYSLAKALERKK